MPAYTQALIDQLNTPAQARTLTAADWTHLIGTARNANLLGKLAAALETAGALPDGNPGRHLRGALQLSVRQRQSVTWEANRIDAALAVLDRPVVLLKGAAYAMSGHLAGAGRLFGDIDILVPRATLEQVELKLMVNGWTSLKTDAYDQRYYRQWMHEIPPMVHARRGTVIDVHHTILPLTARYRPDPERILAAATPLPGHRCLRIPDVKDLIIHSLCHLVHEGEVDNALRDIHDIACLLQSQQAQPGFSNALAAAIQAHDLGEPVAFGLRLVHTYFPQALIPGVLEALDAGRWATHHARLVRRHVRAIAPSPTGTIDRSAAWARQMIYLRAHRLRMPLPMLARHLARKAWLRLTERPQSPPQTH